MSPRAFSHDAGLVLGCPGDALVTRNVTSFLPVGPKVTALFEDPVKPGTSEAERLVRRTSRQGRTLGSLFVQRDIRETT
jgi:hypothetical protein